ncbi:MAG: dTDP-4-dehydrorhamnose reductase [Muribaculaceae bacterium]|nr:dTDP-4-dehydrorhamnose reductase [Muribaculaceae bacterium]
MNTTKHILITGANGQLGREMRRLLDGDAQFAPIYTDVEELDITNQDAVNRFIETHPVEYIVNCAAYTAVDRAEDDEATARLINVDAVSNLAAAASPRGIKVVHVSTDYVFDGTGCRPYREDDPVNPLSAYGRTKLAGEQALMDITAHDAVILRTAWLYSPHGKNFVKTMLQLGRTRDALQVVYDQVGNPTSATDLAHAIVTVLTAPQWHPGIYHVAGEGAVSWYDFTKAIHRLAGITTCNVSPCLSDQFPAKAHRPHYSVLDKAKFKSTFGTTLPYWEDSLRQCIDRLNQLT